MCVISQAQGLNHLMTFVTASCEEQPSEEALRDQEASILQLGEKYREEGKTKEMTELISYVRRLLKFMSKAKAAKIVRDLVDMFLDMRKEGESGDKEVELCKVTLSNSLPKTFSLDKPFNLSIAYLTQ